MYICHECERTFEEPKPYENGYICPWCEGSDYSEARECDNCGEYFGAGSDGCFTDKYGHRFCSEYCAVDYHGIGSAGV